jgi:hypothetical protein
MSFVRLYDSVKQFVAKSGVPMSGGKVKVFIHNTDDLASLYADAAGTTPLSNPMSIDTDGRTLGVFVADGSLYRIEVYGVSGNLEWTVDNVTGGSGGGGGSGISSISSSDGSITIFQDGNDIDLTMTNDKPTVWVSDDNPAVYEQYLNEDGNFVLAEGAKVGTGLELVDGTLTVREDGWYHISVNWNVEKGGGYRGETREIKLLVNGEVAGETLDMSMGRDLRYGAWNGDLELEAGDTIVFSTDGLEDDHKTAARLNKVSVHKLASVIGGNTYTAGNGISLSPQNVISVDTSVVATQQDLGDINEVPASTSGDSGKVLTVNSSGTPAWAPAQGGKTYTAGHAISITDGQNDDKVINVKLKTNGGLKFYNATLSPDWNSIEVKTDNYTTGLNSSGELIVANPLPFSTASEANKVLTVDSQGIPVWDNIVVPTPTVPAPAYLFLVGTSGSSSISLSADEAAAISDKSIFTLSGFIGLGDDFSPQTTATMLTLVLSLSDQNGNTVLASGPLMVEPNSRNARFSGFITGYGMEHGGVVSVAATSVQDGPEGATYSVFKLRNIHLIGY